MLKRNTNKFRRGALLTFALTLLLSACGGGSNSAGTPGSPGGDVNISPEIKTSPYFFVADNGVNGNEIWTSDGTEDGTIMLKDTAPYGSSNPKKYIKIGTTLFFTADDGVNGRELWKTDLTTNVSSLVKDFNPDGGVTFYSYSEYNGMLYIVVDDGNTTSLWKSDGTEAGTTVIGQVSSNSDLWNAVSIGSNLYFTGNDDIYITDGLSVTHLDTSGQFSRPSKLTVFNGGLYFIAYNSAEGYEVWKSDGTDIGTDILISTDPGFTSYGVSPSFYGNIFALGDSLVILSTETGTSANYQYLWVSDGTKSGTVKALDSLSTPIQIGSSDKSVIMNGVLYLAGYSYPYPLKSFDGTTLTEVSSNGPGGLRSLSTDGSKLYLFTYNQLYVNEGASSSILVRTGFNNPSKVIPSETAGVYFTASSYKGPNEYSLFYNDGTVDGTNLLPLSGYDLYSSDLAIDGSTIYYSKFLEGNGVEPVSFDRSTSTTVELGNLNQTSRDSGWPGNPVYVNGLLYFIVNKGVKSELWVSDGTSDGTVRLGDSSSVPLNYLYGLTVSGGKVYFVGNTAEHGDELWVSDGTLAGTHMIVDLIFGSEGSYISGIWDVNGMTYFNANDILWKTSGEAGDITPVYYDYVSRIFPLANSNKFLFSGALSILGSPTSTELLISDGLFGGTQLVKDINPTGYSLNYNFEVFTSGDDSYLVADDGVSGRELWRTDGTEDGTFRVSDINTTSFKYGLDNNPIMFALDQNVYFFTSASDGVRAELWKVLDDNAGVEKITDFTTDSVVLRSYSSEKTTYAEYKGNLFFAAQDPVNGNELWKTDGTLVGTKLFKNIALDDEAEMVVNSSSPECLMVKQDMLYFFANDFVHGKELWVSDGTETGTHLVKDITPGLLEGVSCLNPTYVFDD